jgi:hypothetical protein
MYCCVLRDPYKERKRLAANPKSLSTHVVLHFPVSTVLGAVAELRIAALRAQGLGWKRIATDLRVGAGTIYRFAGK